LRTRSQELRARGRRIFTWSLAAALVIHVAVFLLSPSFHTELLTSREIRLDPSGSSFAIPVLLALHFGPPMLTAPDGTTRKEPPERVLDVERLVAFPEECAPFQEAAPTALRGSVRLSVNPSGLTKVVDTVVSTGNPCGDQVMAIVAAALWYHWLPNDAFPAPVDVEQPITMSEVQP